MPSAAFSVAMVALSTSITAVQVFSSLENQGTVTTLQAVQALLPLAAMGALLASVASIYHQLHRAAAAAAGTGADLGGGIILCAVVSLLEFLVFAHPAAEVEDGARARELIGMAAAHVLPAAATATFFVSMVLLFVACVRVGNGAAAVAGDGPVKILLKVSVGATAVLLGLVALAAL